MLAGAQGHRPPDPGEGSPPSGHRHAHRAGEVDAVDLHVEPAAGHFAAGVQLDQVRTGSGDVDRVLQPLAGLDVVDGEAARVGAGRRGDDVDVFARAVLPAGVAGHEVVIGEALSAEVEVLRFERAGNGERQAQIRRLAGAGAAPLAADRAGGGAQDGVDVGAEVLAVGAGVVVRAGRGQPVVVAAPVDEADVVERRRIAGRGRRAALRRIEAGRRADDHVLRERVPGRIRVERSRSLPHTAAEDAVVAPLEDVVAEDRVLVPVVGERGVAEGDGRVAGADGVVIDDQVEDAAGTAGAVDGEQLERPAAIDPVDEVVADENARGLLARVKVVRAGHVEAAEGVSEDVLLVGDVLHRAPGAVAVLVPDGEEDGQAGLPVDPVVLQRNWDR